MACEPRNLERHRPITEFAQFSAAIAWPRLAPHLRTSREPRGGREGQPARHRRRRQPDDRRRRPHRELHPGADVRAGRPSAVSLSVNKRLSADHATNLAGLRAALTPCEMRNSAPTPTRSGVPRSGGSYSHRGGWVDSLLGRWRRQTAPTLPRAPVSPCPSRSAVHRLPVTE